ncbi:MAG: SDR family oxidoreductase [Syntrophales bacterium]|jgi:NAD(P)-dependent dehydrogenase (short-subunit alcohol dehydrogenase family)|nr:SDR family oxidoreductase [Syntrophales bacterium]MDY0043077.1 SDR family NAD(P)-dependent oxidoreductase [Syntrophales bacterium]
MKLQNKVAIITGSGRGIGRAIAGAFAREGAKLVLMARTVSQLEEVKRHIETSGGEALVFPGDLSHIADIDTVVGETVRRFGPPDILVNNASLQNRSLTLDVNEEAWQHVIQVNLTGTFFLTKRVLKHMIPMKSGRIINILSVNAKTGHLFGSAYAASKHGMLGVTRSLALEMGFLGIPGITVNAICPGPVKTEMMEGEGGLLDFVAKARTCSREEAIRFITDMNMQKRMLEPEEIASLALYLASDEAKGITGQAINVCAGQVMI